MTGVMSRHVVTIAGVILVICGLLPKIGALIASMPLPVLGGGVIVMFGCRRWHECLSEVNDTTQHDHHCDLRRRLGLNLVPTAVQYLPVFGNA